STIASSVSSTGSSHAISSAVLPTSYPPSRLIRHHHRSSLLSSTPILGQERMYGTRLLRRPVSRRSLGSYPGSRTRSRDCPPSGTHWELSSSGTGRPEVRAQTRCPERAPADGEPTVRPHR